MLQGISNSVIWAIFGYGVVSIILFLIAFDICSRIFNRLSKNIANDVSLEIGHLLETLPILVSKPMDIKHDQFDVTDGYHTVEELYNHRHALFINLMWQWYNDCWWSKIHSDGSFYEGYVLCGISLPDGNVTYHIPDSLIHYLPVAKEIPKGKIWDGHNSDDVIFRLLKSSFKKHPKS